MDLNWARTFFTVCVFISFMIVLFIVFNKRNRDNYDDAANSIINDPDTDTDEQSIPAHSNHDNGAK